MLQNKRQLLFGILLLVIGFFAMLSNWQWPFDLGPILGGLFLIAIGYLILQNSAQKLSKWFAFIMGSLLIALGLLIILNALFPVVNDLTGILFLWLAALIFGGLYVRNEKQWWAVIVAGVLFTNGSISVLHSFSLINPEYFSGIFFLGIGLTFSFLWMVGRSTQELSWARFPALVLLLFSLWQFVSLHYWVNFSLIIALLIILTGIFLTVKALSQKNA